MDLNPAVLVAARGSFLPRKASFAIPAFECANT
jgi:hypothetical protein